MLGISWTELLIVLIVAVVVIGPRELPQAMYGLGRLVRKLTLVSRNFQKVIDDLVREADLQDIERNANAIMGRPVEEVMKERGLDRTREDGV